MWRSGANTLIWPSRVLTPLDVASSGPLRELVSIRSCALRLLLATQAGGLWQKAVTAMKKTTARMISV
jgi:hypothetical protein